MSREVIQSGAVEEAWLCELKHRSEHDDDDEADRSRQGEFISCLRRTLRSSVSRFVCR